MVKVGICTTRTAGSGIGNYTGELIHALRGISSVEVREIPVQSYGLPVLGPYLTTSYGVRKQLQKYDSAVDVFHLPAQTQAAGLVGLNLSTPVVVTVHDLIPLVSSYDNLLLRSFARVYERGLYNADEIVAISEHTKRDVLERLNYPEKHTHVVYPSISFAQFEHKADKTVLSRLNITEPYVLYVGSQTLKKNVRVLVEALKQLPEELTLVVVGDPGLIPGYLTKHYAKKHDVDDRVRQTGFVDVDVLARLYDSALAFVFPSQYEGFGRPPLEAMAVGTPVIATSSTAVPEIVNGAAILCDPDQPDEWAGAISDLLKNDERRDEMIERGHERVDQFSWERCASETVNVYLSVTC
jgi:glycosyltransferase involved in cell wall biosynthesis